MRLDAIEAAGRFTLDLGVSRHETTWFNNDVARWILLGSWLRQPANFEREVVCATRLSIQHYSP